MIAFAAGVLCLVLIRQKDFVVRGGPPPRRTRPADGPEHAAERPPVSRDQAGSRPCGASQATVRPWGTIPDGFTSRCTR